MRGRSGLRVVTAGLGVTLVVGALYVWPPHTLRRIDLAFYDLLLRWTHRSDISERLLVVDVDERSLAEVGRWPWPRSRLAGLLRRIGDGGAVSVAVDMMFPEPDEPASDRALADVLRHGPFIVGYAFTFGRDGPDGRGCLPPPVAVVSRHRNTEEGDADTLFRATGVLCNTAAIAEAVSGAGFLNASPHADGILRRIPLLIEYGGRIYPSLALATLMRAHGTRQVLVDASTRGAPSVQTGELVIPLDARGNLLVHFRGARHRFPYVSAADVLADRLPAATFRDRIVIVGTSALGVREVVATPLDPLFAGVEVHATVVDNVLLGDFRRRPSWAPLLEISLLLLCAAGSAWLLHRTRVSLGLLAAGATGVGVWVACAGAARAWGIVVSPLLPTVALLGGVSMGTLLNLASEIERRRHEARVLAELARRITASLDLDAILQQVTDAARDLCQADLARIALHDGDSDALLVRYWTGGEGRDSTTWRMEPGNESEGRVLVVPVRVASRIEGLLYVEHVRPRTFTARDELVLRRLADHAAIALHNAQLFAASERRRRAAERVLRVNQTISGSLDIDIVAQEIASAAAALMTVPVVALWVADETRQLLERRAVASEASIQDVPRAAIHFGDGLVGWIARHRQMLSVDDALADARPLDPEWWRAHHLVSFLGIPIESEGALLGVLGMMGRRRFRLGPDDTVLLQGFTAQVTAAIRNARLYGERTQAYEELVRTQDQLLQVQKMEAMGRLAGGIAHDFNNLLTVLLGRSELLLRHLPEADPACRHVDVIRSAGERAAALTQQLLAFSRKQVLQRTVLDLAAVMVKSEELLRRLIGEDIHLVTRPGPKPCTVMADATQLEQVLLNLTVNARDAMPQGGQLTLETQVVDLDAAFVHTHPGARPGPHAMLVVRDTGAGMDLEVQRHIFEPFFTTKERAKGTGLGLATVFGIVKQHDGYVTVESAPGRGATFRLYFPLVEAMTAVSVPAPAGTALDGTETVLVVEDDTTLRELVAEILTGYGYEVIGARHPGEALLIVERRSMVIDLLLTDIVMPEMNGPELAERLTTLRPGLKVICMTGYSDDALVPRMMTVLPKPFTSIELAKRVREVLDAPRAQDETTRIPEPCR